MHSFNEDILVCLSTDEGRKHALAKELQIELLKSKTSVRILKPDDELLNVLTNSSFKFYIFDFFLGSFGTVIDLFQELSNDQRKKLKFMVWTDENSIRSVTDVMKLGAIDFVSMNTANTTRNVVTSLLKEFEKSPTTKNLPSGTRHREIIFRSNVFSRLSPLVRSSIENQKCVTICGEPGTLKSSYAKYILESLDQYPVREIDASIYNSCVVKSIIRTKNYYSNSTNQSDIIFLVKNAELVLSDLIDGCEILTSVMKTTRGIIFTSCSTNDCALLSKSFGGEVVTIPSLAECKTEIKHVANGILVDCLAVFNLKENCLDETHYSFLEEVGWPENFKQLESVVTNAVCLKSHQGSTLLDALKLAYSLFQDNKFSTGKVNYSPIELLAALRKAHGSIRLASIRMGINPWLLSQSVNKNA